MINFCIGVKSQIDLIAIAPDRLNNQLLQPRIFGEVHNRKLLQICSLEYLLSENHLDTVSVENLILIFPLNKNGVVES